MILNKKLYKNVIDTFASIITTKPKFKTFKNYKMNLIEKIPKTSTNLAFVTLKKMNY